MWGVSARMPGYLRAALQGIFGQKPRSYAVALKSPSNQENHCLTIPSGPFWLEGTLLASQRVPAGRLRLLDPMSSTHNEPGLAAGRCQVFRGRVGAPVS